MRDTIILINPPMRDKEGENMPIYRMKDFLSDEEKKHFTEEQMEITYDELFDIIKGEKGSFAETADGDVDKALITMKALARMRGQAPLTSVYAYLYGNKTEHEAEFQMKVQAAIVKKIREEAGLTQQEFSDLCELKKRTLENWEQGERRLTRCALDYLIARSRAQEDDVYSMVQYHAEDIALSQETYSLLKELSECEFRDEINGHDASDYPRVRFLNRNMMNAPEYMIRVEKEEYIENGQVTYKHDLFPEDLRNIMHYAVKKNCDEVYIPLPEDSSYVKYMRNLCEH